MKTMFACAVILGCLSFAAAHCPNMCTGHGSCGPDDVCTCYNGFTFPDCSARLCRESTAWFARRDKTLTGHDGAYNYEAWTTVTTAHGLETECSNAGLCDRKTGQCKCFNGWTGTACERTLCPGGMNCNGHGTCESIREQNVLTKLQDSYGYYSDDDDTWIYPVGGNDGSDGNQVSSTDRDQSYTGAADYIDADYVDGGDTDHWDADKIVGCNCDFGWTGFDCSYRLCPRGDDPIYVRSTLEDTTFTFHNGDAIITPLTYSFTYYGKDTDDITFYSADTETNVMAEERISEVLHRHPYIKDVTVEVTFETVEIAAADTHVGMAVKLTFNQIHSQIFLIDGTEEDDTSFNPRDITLNLKIDDALVAGTGPAGLATPFGDDGGDITTSGAYQHMECSMRGMCDSSTGLCKCFEGYTGDACEVQSSLAF